MKKNHQFPRSLLQIPIFRQLWVFWKAITASWRIYLEAPVPVAELAHSREAASIPSFGFFFLLISATVIATLGLISNSAAVIIGAMIVAPLMNPILSMSFAIVTANWTLYKRSIVTVFLGTASAILVAYLISALLPVNIVGSEIVARTSPSLIDLGIAIAAGAAGAFSLTRQSIASSIAGVAIAVALVPPLCVVGIGLGVGSNLAADFGIGTVTHINVSAGAFLLFLANLAGITFTGCLVFLAQSYGSLTKAFQTILVWLLMMLLLCGPLTDSVKEFFVANRLGSELRQMGKEHPKIHKQIQIVDVRVRLEGTTAYVNITILAPKNLLTQEYLQKSEQRLFDSLSKMGVRAMGFRLRIVPVEIQEYQSISS